MENREKAGKGVCILSFDGGGPGSLSQLRILEELMLRLGFEPEDEPRPADYFDIMGGVGFGGLVALLLGRLRMTTSQAMEELTTIGTETFPQCDSMVDQGVNMARLRKAIENMLVRHSHAVDTPLHNSDSQCKVVLFAGATTKAIGHRHAFRTYRARRKCLECTFVDAACATMATPEHFSPVAIGPRLRKQTFTGIPLGLDNPMREVLKESQMVFGGTHPVSLVLSLGPGRRARLSDLGRHVTRLSRIHYDDVAKDLQHQLCSIGEYLRLNVDHGLEMVELDDWSELGSIETCTNVYLETTPITNYIDEACQWVRQRSGTVNLGQLSGTSTEREIRFRSERLADRLEMQVKQMDNIMGTVGVTVVDAIGRPIWIPMDYCDTYTMLLRAISFYFELKKPRGSDFVERGDYRLVHGDRKNTMGEIEWTCIDKVGLKVEMSMILRTRNQKSQRCPSCNALFDAHAMDAWAKCQTCKTQFQTETQVEVEDTTQRDEEPLEELMTPTDQPQMRESTSSGEAAQLQFRLISVINITPTFACTLAKYFFTILKTGTDM